MTSVATPEEDVHDVWVSIGVDTAHRQVVDRRTRPGRNTIGDRLRKTAHDRSDDALRGLRSAASDGLGDDCVEEGCFGNHEIQRRKHARVECYVRPDVLERHGTRGHGCSVHAVHRARTRPGTARKIHRQLLTANGHGDLDAQWHVIDAVVVHLLHKAVGAIRYLIEMGAHLLLGPYLELVDAREHGFLSILAE